MIAQEQTSSPQSNSVLSLANTISTDVCTQVVMEESHVPKIRKPYTITKQRKKWSEEEHEKFLEALKLHGRAWKKIEEHVGSKTAVQIRSHAQKFFSKVIRETSSTSASSTAPIEIPPPRPKRKPSRPYPRKHVLPTHKENPIDQLTRFPSPNSSIHESRSPTSVLSPLASDNLASEDSPTRNGSPSLTSFAEGVNSAGLLPSEDSEQQDDVQMSSVITNDPVSVKLEPFPSLDSVEKPTSVSTKIFKLFGQDVIVPSAPSYSSPSLSTGEVLQKFVDNFQPDMRTPEKPWDYRTFDYVDETKNHVAKPISQPLWVSSKGMADRPFECLAKNAEKDAQREGSCADSSSESVIVVGNTDNNCDSECQSGQCTLQLRKENENREEANMKKKSTLSILGNSYKGFVPYKRSLLKRGTLSSAEGISEEEGKKVRLGL
ncbi:hypothetical protein vseg_009989 [Gypsophila vaccaria]